MGITKVEVRNFPKILGMIRKKSCQQGL